MDSLTPQERHVNMSRIRGSNTLPERQIRSALFRAGFRYRKCDRRYPGSPDLVFPHYYAVVFINGCFWHAHEGCSYFRVPKSNAEFWERKFRRNRERDARNMEYYREQCWRVCVVWECAIRGRNGRRKIESVKDEIINWLEDPSLPFLEIKA